MTPPFLTPRSALLGVRIGVAGGAALMLLLMLGPFQGAEAHLGLSDKAAHLLAFYALTIGLHLSAPDWRRTDLALFALGFGLLVEVAQGIAGREMSTDDLLADGLGIAAATLPGLVERLRHHTRSRPDQSLFHILRADRRGSRAPATRLGPGLFDPRRPPS